MGGGSACSAGGKTFRESPLSLPRVEVVENKAVDG
jgi:hypothetical protein